LDTGQWRRRRRRRRRRRGEEEEGSWKVAGSRPVEVKF
jgi:hypothetical protein